MKPRIIAVIFLLLASQSPAQAGFLARMFDATNGLERQNRQLRGRIIDYTFNHGVDRRMYSRALDEKRDMYVYVPPNFDPNQQYPLVVLMHGFNDDEHVLLKFVEQFDAAMVDGTFPAMVVVAPDGSIAGRGSLLRGGSFFVNSPRAGRFGDYVMEDVWGFIHQHYPIRPEREAHVLFGGSMGGFGAYNLGIKHRDRVGVVVGIFPPLNTRYLDCNGRYFTNFDPECIGWRTKIRPLSPVARFAFGLVSIRQRRVVKPLYGRSPDVIAKIAAENPVEMLFSHDIQPGELEMFVGYVGRDAFNIDAQVESFVYFARGKGLSVSTVFHPEGRHNTTSAQALLPSAFAWLRPRVGPYAPGIEP